MSSSKVAISLPGSLLARLDEVARKSGLSRSAVVRRAVESSLSVEPEVVRRARRVYASIEDEERALSEAFLPLAAETLPRGERRRERKRRS